LSEPIRTGAFAPLAPPDGLGAAEADATEQFAALPLAVALPLAPADAEADGDADCATDGLAAVVGELPPPVDGAGVAPPVQAPIARTNDAPRASTRFIRMWVDLLLAPAA